MVSTIHDFFFFFLFPLLITRFPTWTGNFAVHYVKIVVGYEISCITWLSKLEDFAPRIYLAIVLVIYYAPCLEDGIGLQHIRRTINLQPFCDGIHIRVIITKINSWLTNIKSRIVEKFTVWHTVIVLNHVGLIARNWYFNV